MNGTKPIKLESIRKEYLWGTEDWLISCLHEGYESIPLLIKKITAQEALSVQVHPDDRYAQEKEGCSGKTEMWYVLDCEPDAYLYYGLKHRISTNEFLKRIQNGTITEVCRKVSVKKGDVFYIPAGLLHAIGKGITVVEIQQSSNITYRVYDYQREDKNHKLRELHIDQAAAVAGFLPPLQGHRPMGLRQKKNGYEKILLVQCPYFTVYQYEIKDYFHGSTRGKFAVLYVTDGNGMLHSKETKLLLEPGDCIYLPEGMSNYEITGNVSLLMSEV